MGSYKFTILLPFFIVFIVLNSRLGNSQLPPGLFPGTFDLDCGGTSLPPPSPSLSACLWCGYGTCVKDGDANVCKCDQGSANLFNKKDMPCFKECSLGADCINLGFDFGSPPAPGTENGTSPPPPSSTSFGLNKTGQGSGSAQDAPSSSGARQTLTMLVVVGTFLSWF
ncbi:uncharacterized protein LOC113302565 isoform X3 [Papaver somniferum]|uniref:uncharacterized protein LOC113302565 isoform X3 n=1 Tax=Papaver somniferum TaxID=3469 RepID=UPI000E7012FC|nr:uncharacterized protein LOC113302565 isoform X3 [Papaver somniferum]